MGIKVVELCKSYEGKVILDNINLEIPKGSFTTILAPTGSGKTTLLRIMAGIEKPSKGRVYYDGRDVTDVPVKERNISMVYQQFINYPSLTVYENIASPLRVSHKKLSKKEIDKKVREIAETLRITHVLDHLPEEISGGEKQRTAIARALIKGSEYVFLDEPLGNLDYKLREELRVELKMIFKDCTIIYATPEPIDALSMSTHVAYISGGKVLQFDSVQEVYSKPRFVEVGYFFSDPPMNILDCKLINKSGNLYIQSTEEIEINVNNFKSCLNEDEYILGIRPHDLSIIKNNKDLKPFSAKIDFVEIVGSTTTFHISHKNKRLGLVVQGIKRQFKKGQDIDVYIDPKKVFIYEKKTKKLIIAQGEKV